MWLAGTQIVGLNLHDNSWQNLSYISTNNAMFASNGGSGYVLKPNVLLTGPETTCILTLKIVEARHLRSFKFINEQLFEPHIRASIVESEQKDEYPQMWDTAKESVDKKQKKNLMNGFHTIWDAEFKER